MSCSHGEWHEKDCEICVLTDEVWELKAELAKFQGCDDPECYHNKDGE